MKHLTRRNFVKGVASVSAGAFTSGVMAKAAPFSRTCSANDDIRIAIIGLNGKGRHHIHIYRNQIKTGVRIVAICDPDRKILAETALVFAKDGVSVDTHVDLRDVLDRKDIDAVVIATPNHWHSLCAIWACQAGKDVYVEKPVSHNIWEGRKLVEAARKYKRIVQAGTQNRSDKGMQKAIQYIKEGNLGKIQLVHGISYKRRKSIGKVDGPQPIPKPVDYNLWCGPAPMAPLMRKRLHYDWHWVWPTGNGDIGNMGIHTMDLCRWFVDQPALAPKVMSIGGRFGYIDDGQTPNTQITLLDYKPVPIIFEVKGLPRKKDDSALSHYKGVRVGPVVQCEGGYFDGGWAYDNDGKKIKQFFRDGGGGHQANFLKAVRSRKQSDLNADILEGHISSALCHQANISYQIGSQAAPDKIEESLKGNDGMLETFERFKKHLAANEIDLDKTQAILGPTLQMEPLTETFKGTMSEEANKMLSRNYREPFIVPEKV